MSIGQYYRRAALYPMAFVVPAVFFYGVYDNMHYKSEWMTGDTFALLGALFAFFYCFAIATIGLTILLVKNERIKKNPLHVAIAWFALPVFALILVAIYGITTISSAHAEGWNGLPYLLIMIIPYLASFYFNYWKFRKDPAQQ